jgi:hypothetical protein
LLFQACITRVRKGQKLRMYRRLRCMMKERVKKYLEPAIVHAWSTRKMTITPTLLERAAESVGRKLYLATEIDGKKEKKVTKKKAPVADK